ncbi:MAG: hypothetical protein ACYDGN_03495 [Acidimicrobiales bacterium]
MSVAFLSQAWFDALGQRLGASPAPQGERIVRIGQLVTGLPEGGDCSWLVVLAADAPPELQIGTLEGADAVLVESYQAALDLARGERTAAQLLEAGEIKLRGDAGCLVALSSQLEAVAAASRLVIEPS